MRAAAICAPLGLVMRNATAIPSSDTPTPSRTAHAVGRGRPRSRSRTTPTTAVALQSTTIVTPMSDHSAVSSGVATSKWLARPRITCPTITAISTTAATATTVPATPAHRRARDPETNEIIQASVVAYRTKETLNFSGFAQIGCPPSVRGSSRRPATHTTARRTIDPASRTSDRFHERMRGSLETIGW